MDPDILIVDEVLSVGDMAFQLKCFKRFEDFKKRGKTILFVTHSVGDILRNCDRAIIISSGEKIFDGDAKPGVEKYKKIIVNADSNNEKEAKDEKNKANNDKNFLENETWKKHFNENPKLIKYGNNKAEVIDYGIFSEDNNYLQTIESNKEIILKSKIKFYENVENPIFTVTIKDFRGNDIYGTNTLIEKVYTGNYKNGDLVTVEFRQRLPIAPGKYTVSFSCTQFNQNGELEVLSRKYDALLIEVISNKEYVGLMVLDSKIEINKINN